MNIGTVNSLESITVGGVTLPLRNVIVLSAMAAGTIHYQTFRKNGVNYQVTTGKTLKIWAARFRSAAVGDAFVIGHATAAVDNGSAPAGWTAITDGTYADDIARADSVHTVREMPCFKEIPSGKYPTFLSPANSGYMQLICTEE